MKATAKAHTNIALIKYWGKRNEELILPTNSSLSITLDRFYTETTVEFNEQLTSDSFYLNGEQASEKETLKVTKFLNLVRELSGDTRHATVSSTNHVPTAAGFASSASGYAALAAAASKASGLQLEGEELSKLARRGSGSACRSIYGGFVEWQKGTKDDGSDSYAVPILEQEAWDLSILSVMIESKQKKILSREGMKRTVETSPFYDGWLKATEEELQIAKKAIEKRDFELLGETLEKNAFKMHATTLGADPPFFYWQPATLEIIDYVQQLRSQGVLAYVTIDAGPNVKVICEPKDEQKVYQTLSEIDSVKEIFVCHPGPGISYL
ncbi:diphosphomevalonate decarboxylase [Pallidibacillus pasinlerensis]|uniref:diphosphomevalonate decarboxylase n=1 Tax=Pallidibacillus pasinlerensis TaxID=2703818 RepID=A0ABX0A4H3_9BACI|nr:diphosphomevalonate decarboxylase [Pallidibacillus pasinlerensis]NCU18334.1 diphosphomevalonate decarboxylase [Pallidibacillus pasinlerensis]